MSSSADYAALDAMLDARLEALSRRASDGGDVSFSTSEGERDPQTDDLWNLIELARKEDEQSLSFSTSDTVDEGLLAQARRECAQFMRGVLQSVSHREVVETGEGRRRVRTQVGWTGDINTYIAPDTSATQIATHVAAMEASMEASGQRLRLLTMIVVASGRIAALMATPGAAITALPVAYRCVRDVYEQWRGHNGRNRNQRGAASRGQHDLQVHR